MTYKAISTSVRAVAIAAALFVGATAGAAEPSAPAPPAHGTRTPTGLHHAAPAVANPHLHLPSARTAPAAGEAKTKAPAKTVKTEKEEKEAARTHLHHGRYVPAYARWSFVHWAALHRGTSTIMGEVVGKSGKPVSGAQVVLRTSKGKAFKSASAKHATSSNAAGQFVMRGVRGGSYRVRATKSKASGHTAIHLGGGRATMVTVKV